MRDYEDVLNIARLLVDDGGNVEYVRGICELIADLFGVPDVCHADKAMQIARELGLSVDLYPVGGRGS